MNTGMNNTGTGVSTELVSEQASSQGSGQPLLNQCRECGDSINPQPIYALVAPTCSASITNSVEIMDSPLGKYVRANYAVKTLHISQLNPEQQLAYAMTALLEQQKETLELMKAVHLLAQECVDWRKTSEGQAWVAAKAAERKEKTK
jgi:hypothetical protein